MENRDNSFNYTYSAAQKAEVEAIRSKYVEPQEDKMETLRKLHNSANEKAMAVSLALGVLGSLLLGTGMSLFMTEFGAWLGNFAMVIGIIVGVIGLVLTALAYPVYNHVLKKERQRIAPQILQLTEELLK